MSTTAQLSGCYACDLNAGLETLIGGCIFGTTSWRVEHCMGPLGVGTLIVKPTRHLLHIWELSSQELTEMRPLIGKTSRIVHQIINCDQIYTCLWSHGGFEPVHIHFVVQPVSGELREQYEHAGPVLQTEMFRRGTLPDPHAVEIFCDQAREQFQHDA